MGCTQTKVNTPKTQDSAPRRPFMEAHTQTDKTVVQTPLDTEVDQTVEVADIDVALPSPDNDLARPSPDNDVALPSPEVEQQDDPAIFAEEALNVLKARRDIFANKAATLLDQGLEGASLVFDTVAFDKRMKLLSKYNFFVDHNPFNGKKPKIEEQTSDEAGYFQPTLKLAWLIGNQYYDNVLSNGKQLGDIDQAPDDISEMNAFCGQMGFDVVISMNQTKDQIQTQFQNFKAKVRDAAKQNCKVLFFFYYSGHGVMDAYTFIVMNEEDPDDQKRLFSLEYSMKNWAESSHNLYVIGVMDCCRAKFTSSKLNQQQPNATQNQAVPAKVGLTRGPDDFLTQVEAKGPASNQPAISAIGPGSKKTTVGSTQQPKGSGQPAVQGEGLVANFYVYFACSPGQGTSATSIFAKTYIQWIRQELDKTNGVWLIPDCFQGFLKFYNHAIASSASFISKSIPVSTSIIDQVLYYDIYANQGPWPKYSGESEKDKWHGRGTLELESGDTYEGPFHEGHIQGVGTYKWKDGREYVGEWKRDKKHGDGILTEPGKGTYTGTWKDDFLSGPGIHMEANGNVYRGDFQMDQRQGKGQYSTSDFKYVGSFQSNQRQGDGEISYLKDQKDQKGNVTFRTGDKYVGKWKKDKMQGEGKIDYMAGKELKESKPSNVQPVSKRPQKRFDFHKTQTKMCDLMLNYQGQWLNGKKHGKGILRMADKSEYHGEFVDDKKQGQGTYKSRTEAYGNRNTDEQPPSGYTGTWHQDQMVEGILICSNGTKYEGKLQNNKRHGQGVLTFKLGGFKIDCVWDQDQTSGIAKAHYGDKSYYEGTMKDLKKHGKGKITYADGSVFNGNFENDLKHGQGTFEYPDGSKYQGGFIEDQKWNEGIWTYPDGSKYDGNFKQDRKEGKGRQTYADKSSYDGDWAENARHGQGTQIYQDDTKYEGQWLMDVRHGQGVYTDTNKNIYKGEWENGWLTTGEATYTDSYILKYVGSFITNITQQQQSLLDGYQTLGFDARMMNASKHNFFVNPFNGIKPQQNENYLKRDLYFIPTIAVAWLIGNQHYDKVKEGNLIHLESVPDEILRMKDFCEKMNFQFVISMDCSREEMENQFEYIQAFMKRAHNDKSDQTKVLLFVYYSGLGCTDEQTHIVLNEVNVANRYYKLESQLRACSEYHNTYIVASFNCEREKFELPQVQPIKLANGATIQSSSKFTIQNEILERQFAVDQPPVVSQQKNNSLEKKVKNFYITFACEPEQSVSILSSFDQAYIRCIQENLDMTQGVWQVQESLAAFNHSFPGGNSADYLHQQLYYDIYASQSLSTHTFQWHGTGTLTFKSGDTYEGQFHEGQIQGVGTFKWKEGRKYEGEWNRDKKHGEGILTEADGGQYKGTWKDDFLSGQGIHREANGNEYQGNFKMGKKSGHGVYSTCEYRYTGNFQNDKCHGKGKLLYSNGDTLEGDFAFDLISGRVPVIEEELTVIKTQVRVIKTTVRIEVKQLEISLCSDDVDVDMGDLFADE